MSDCPVWSETDCPAGRTWASAHVTTSTSEVPVPTSVVEDIGTPPTLPATTIAIPTMPPIPPDGLPATGTSGGLVVAAIILTIAGTALRRTARRAT